MLLTYIAEIYLINYVSHLPNHLMTFFSSSSHWSVEIQTKVMTQGSTERMTKRVNSHSLNSYLAFCKTVVKMTIITWNFVQLICNKKQRSPTPFFCLLWIDQHLLPENIYTEHIRQKNVQHNSMEEPLASFMSWTFCRFKLTFKEVQKSVSTDNNACPMKKDYNNILLSLSEKQCFVIWIKLLLYNF